MILPNKLINFNDSILSKIVFILDELENNEEVSVINIYNKVNKCFVDINEYILALDLLFVLGKIQYITEMKVIKYVKTNIL